MTTARDLISNLDDLMKLSKTLVASRLLPAAITTPEAAAVIILKGRELGIGPMEAFSGINVIKGKPSVAPQLMLALIRRSGQLENIAVDDDGKACTVTMKRAGNAAHPERFSMDDAAAMGLAANDNWKKQPKTMRKWRAISACARVVFPDVIAGMYTPEELGADVNEEGEMVEGRETTPLLSEPEPTAQVKPNGNGKREKMLARVNELSETAISLGISIEYLPDTASEAEIIEHGKALKFMIAGAAGQPEPA